MRRQAEAGNALLEGLQSGISLVQQQVTDALSRHSEEIGKRVDKMTEATDGRLVILGVAQDAAGPLEFKYHISKKATRSEKLSPPAPEA